MTEAITDTQMYAWCRARGLVLADDPAAQRLVDEHCTCRDPRLRHCCAPQSHAPFCPYRAAHAEYVQRWPTAGVALPDGGHGNG